MRARRRQQRNDRSMIDQTAQESTTILRSNLQMLHVKRGRNDVVQNASLLLGPI